MRFIFLSTCFYILLASCSELKAQNLQKDGNSLGVTTALQFQNFALPFKDLNSNFTHPGLYIGVELALNKRKTLLQEINTTTYFNRDMGNGFTIGTYLDWRPKLYKNISANVGIGAGWLRSYKPVNAYEWKDGEWKKTAGGRSQVMVPIGIGLQYKGDQKISPFVRYQIVPTLFYNAILPLSLNSFIQTGIRFSI